MPAKAYLRRAIGAELMLADRPEVDGVAAAPAWPDPPLRSSQVAIVGFADETRGEAPFEDPDTEIWILNMLHAQVPRWDRLFELHDRATIEAESAEEKRGTNHLAALQAERTRPIYMVDPQLDIPMSRRMPVEALKAFLGPRCDKLERTPYYTSTFAFMIASAVMGIVQRRQDPHVPEPGEVI